MSLDPGMLADLDALACGHWRTLLIDHGRLAREVERLRKLHTAGVADAVRMAAELAGECDEVDRLRGERDRLKDALDRARDTVGDLRRRAEACTPFVVGHLDANRQAAAERCMGKRQAYDHARRLLALALHGGPDDAPEGKLPAPHEGPPHSGECIVRMSVPRARTCSRGTPACNADYEVEQPAQADLDARAHAQLEGLCLGCRGVGGSEECGDCEVCKGRGTVGGQP